MSRSMAHIVGEEPQSEDSWSRDCSASRVHGHAGLHSVQQETERKVQHSGNVDQNFNIFIEIPDKIAAHLQKWCTDPRGTSEAFRTWFGS